MNLIGTLNFWEYAGKNSLLATKFFLENFESFPKRYNKNVSSKVAA